MDVLRPYDPRRDRPALLDRLMARLAGHPPSGARRLASAFCRLVPAHAHPASIGLVQGGDPLAFAFAVSEGGRCRVTALLCDPPQLPELVRELACWLVPRHARVLVEAEAWWGALGLNVADAARAWSRAGFAPIAIAVLEARLPATRGRAVPDGYTTRRWRTGDVVSAARVMAASPDPVGERYPLTVDECAALIAATPDRGHGGTLWCGDTLAGFVRATPTGDIAQLYVARDHRAQGAGAHLLDLALARMDASRLARARVAMALGNAPAGALYASRGFTRVDGYACRVWPAGT